MSDEAKFTTRQIAMPRTTRCYACFGAPDIVITNQAGNETIPMCLDCAKRCADETGLPSLRAAIEHHERTTKQ